MYSFVIRYLLLQIYQLPFTCQWQLCAHLYAPNQNYSGSPPQLFISLLNAKIVQFKHSFKIPQAIIVVICRTNFQFTRSGGDHELRTPTYANTKGKYVYRTIFPSHDSSIDPQFHWLATAGPVARDLSPARPTP